MPLKSCNMIKYSVPFVRMSEQDFIRTHHRTHSLYHLLETALMCHLPVFLQETVQIF